MEHPNCTWKKFWFQTHADVGFFYLAFVSAIFTMFGYVPEHEHVYIHIWYNVNSEICTAVYVYNLTFFA